MEKIGKIEIRVTGKSGNNELNPENYDIKHIVAMLNNVEDLLYPRNNKERPLISYDIENGSVKHMFKTTIQTIIGFSALLGQIDEKQSIDFLELKTARAIENIQMLSREKNYTFQIKTSLSNTYKLTINPKSTFFRNEKIWVEAEFYFYGILKDAGGKSKANIHLDTEEHGYLAIETGKEFLEEREENLLYKNYGVRAKGKQNLDTGEIDTKTLKLIELIDYTPKFDSNYIKNLIKKSENNWTNFQADGWLNNLRGNYEA